MYVNNMHEMKKNGKNCIMDLVNMYM